MVKKRVLTIVSHYEILSNAINLENILILGAVWKFCNGGEFKKFYYSENPYFTEFDPNKCIT